MPVRHSLSEKDPAARTAVCSVCGPTKIRANGKTWTCAEVARRRNAGYRERNPESTKLSRAHVSPHHLISRDAKTRTGECPVCGLVGIVAYGRGYACENTPGAKGRVSQQAAPLTACRDCHSYLDVAEGICKACSITNLPGNSWSRIDAAHRRVSVNELVHEFTERTPVKHNGDEFVDDRRDRTNPRLRTLGSTLDVSPDWAWALNPNADWSAFDAEANA